MPPYLSPLKLAVFASHSVALLWTVTSLLYESPVESTAITILNARSMGIAIVCTILTLSLLHFSESMEPPAQWEQRDSPSGIYGDGQYHVKEFQVQNVAVSSFTRILWLVKKMSCKY